jgi:hypothetical protein
VDLPFPQVDPAGDEVYIEEIVQDYLQQIDDIVKQSHNENNISVHIMGEMTFIYAMVKALQKIGISCVASTTERDAQEENGIKLSEFRFVKFREYS